MPSFFGFLNTCFLTWVTKGYLVGGYILKTQEISTAFLNIGDKCKLHIFETRHKSLIVGVVFNQMHTEISEAFI